jgi:hypothetical protein
MVLIVDHWTILANAAYQSQQSREKLSVSNCPEKKRPAENTCRASVALINA